jgi:DNA repair protein RAD7
VKKRKLSKAAQAKMKSKEKEKMKKKKAGDDDSDLSSDDNLYTALSKAAAKSSRPKPGDLDVCAQCSKQFTVVSREYVS